MGEYAGSSVQDGLDKRHGRRLGKSIEISAENSEIQMDKNRNMYNNLRPKNWG